MLDQSLIEQAAELLSRARRLVILTGSGVSKESGIPTFRDAMDGLWAKHDPARLATLEGFLNDPPLVWKWYQYRLDLAGNCRPNPGHHAIADLEKHLDRVVVITQNIDGFHQLAGSSDVVELHGSLRRFKCLDGHTGLTLDDLAGQQTEPPRCPRRGCNALVRPDVVWFGEVLNTRILSRAFAESENCDVMLVAGTSGVVQPAASLPFYAKQSRARIIEVNLEASGITPVADIHLAGPSGETLPALLASLKQIGDPV